MQHVVGLTLGFPPNLNSTDMTLNPTGDTNIYEGFETYKTVQCPLQSCDKIASQRVPPFYIMRWVYSKLFTLCSERPKAPKV